MKLRSTIKHGVKYAVSESQREMWRAIACLEQRTRNIVPPFRKQHTNNSDDHFVVISADTANFIRQADLNNQLWRLYDKIKYEPTTINPQDYMCLLDAIDIARTILESDDGH